MKVAIVTQTKIPAHKREAGMLCGQVEYTFLFTLGDQKWREKGKIEIKIL